MILVAGRKRVPSPATGKTALRIGLTMKAPLIDDDIAFQAFSARPLCHSHAIAASHHALNPVLRKHIPMGLRMVFPLNVFWGGGGDTAKNEYHTNHTENRGPSGFRKRFPSGHPGMPCAASRPGRWGGNGPDFYIPGYGSTFNNNYARSRCPIVDFRKGPKLTFKGRDCLARFSLPGG